MILTDPLSDYARRIKNIRGIKELTQTQFAERIGVSYASVNRWENEQSRPNNLAWQRILEMEASAHEDIDYVQAIPEARSTPPLSMDFSANPDAISAVAEAHRLTYGHLFNSALPLKHR